METTKYLTRLLSGVFKMALLNFCSSNFFFVDGDHHSLKIFILFKLKYFQNVTKTIIKTLEVRGCLLSFWKRVFVGFVNNNVVYFDQLSGAARIWKLVFLVFFRQYLVILSVPPQGFNQHSGVNQPYKVALNPVFQTFLFNRLITCLKQDSTYDPS